jgi:hypothetical protein
MTTRSALIIGIAILLGFLSLKVVPGVRTGGRYQVHSVGTTTGNNPLIILIDTETGRCWSRSAYENAGKDWHELGSPFDGGQGVTRAEGSRVKPVEPPAP